MNRIGLIGLVKMELPTGDVRLCDGGFIEFDKTYTSRDATFGTVAEITPLNEGASDEIPALEVTFYPTGAAEDLSQPGFQTSRVRFWIGEYDRDSEELIGTPDLMFDGQIDQTVLQWAPGERTLSMTIVSTAERLFQRNAGNSLSDAWHQSIWTGELGHANATNLAVPVAWGTESPQRKGGYIPTAGLPVGSGGAVRREFY